MKILLDARPRVAASAFVAPGASLIGAVDVGAFSSVWFGAVLRADINTIKIGRYSNIQDGSILHVADDGGVEVGDYVTVGHRVVLHACRIGSHVLVGMGAVVLNGARVGAGSRVAAGSIVAENFHIPENVLVAGAPARIKRELKPKERRQNTFWAEKYARLIRSYKTRGIR